MCASRTEFAAGHVPGAVNVPRGMLEFRIADLQPDGNAPVLVYCKTSGRGAVLVSHWPAWAIPSCASVAGGFDQWLAEGLPVEHATLPSFD